LGISTVFKIELLPFFDILVNEKGAVVALRAIRLVSPLSGKMETLPAAMGAAASGGKGKRGK